MGVSTVDSMGNVMYLCCAVQVYLATDPLKVCGQHFDLVLNGVELGGGSIRNHSAEMQRTIIEDVLQVSGVSVLNLDVNDIRPNVVRIENSIWVQGNTDRTSVWLQRKSS